MDPIAAGEIFKACCVLQNLAANESEDMEQFDLQDNDNDLDIDGPPVTNCDPRKEIIKLMRKP